MKLGPRLTWLDAPAGADESCYIETVLGVVSVLRAIAVARTATDIYIDSGATRIRTCLLGVEEDPPTLFFEKGADAALNARVLESARIIFVTSDQGVPVQFNCLDPRAATYGTLEAFGAPLPPRILRLQRRSYFRLSTPPASQAPACELVLESADAAPAQVLQPDVLDISCGGLGAAVPAALPQLEPGSRSECRLDLPGSGSIHTLVEVRAASDTKTRTGREGRRYGMAFVELAAKSVAAIQRYILEQQRARSARARG